MTQLLDAWAQGDREAAEPLFELVYPILRRQARRQLRVREGMTVQPTEVVHEVFLKLATAGALGWRDRLQFFAFSARLIRQVLVDRHRRRDAVKRGGDAVVVAFESRHGDAPAPDLDLLALDQALERLASIDPEAVQVVELRYFGGLTIPEVARVLGLATATVSRRWGMARAWLHRELAPC